VDAARRDSAAIREVVDDATGAAPPRKRVQVVFDRRVPQAERRWMARLIRRCARLWDCEDFEYRVAARRMGRTLGTCTVKVLSMATIVEIVVNPVRFPEREAMRVDLVHELLHVLDEEVRQAFVDLAAHVPDDRRRARALRRAERRYEAWHDKHARVWARLIR
jgi:hypothetical protein